MHEALEDGRKAGWAQPTRAPDERRERRIAGSEGVEGVDVELERQHPLEGGARLGSRALWPSGAGQSQAKGGRLGSALLGHGDLDGRAVEHEHAAVGRSVSGVNLVQRSAAQRPVRSSLNGARGRSTGKGATRVPLLDREREMVMTGGRCGRTAW